MIEAEVDQFYILAIVLAWAALVLDRGRFPDMDFKAGLRWIRAGIIIAPYVIT